MSVLRYDSKMEGNGGNRMSSEDSGQKEKTIKDIEDNFKSLGSCRNN